MSHDVTGAHTAVEEAPGGHAAPADTSTNRKRTLIALAILGVLLLLVAAAFAWYLITKKPLTELPGLNREAMPSFSYSIYAVDQPMGVAVSDDGVLGEDDPVGPPRGSSGPRSVIADRP